MMQKKKQKMWYYIISIVNKICICLWSSSATTFFSLYCRAIVSDLRGMKDKWQTS